MPASGTWSGLRRFTQRLDEVEVNPRWAKWVCLETSEDLTRLWLMYEPLCCVDRWLINYHVSVVLIVFQIPLYTQFFITCTYVQILYSLHICTNWPHAKSIASYELTSWGLASCIQVITCYDSSGLCLIEPWPIRTRLPMVKRERTWCVEEEARLILILTLIWHMKSISTWWRTNVDIAQHNPRFPSYILSKLSKSTKYQKTRLKA